MRDRNLFLLVTPSVIFSLVAPPFVKILPMVFTRSSEINIDIVTACVSCQLYLLRDALEHLISRETAGLARYQKFPTHLEVSTVVVKEGRPE